MAKYHYKLALLNLKILIKKMKQDAENFFKLIITLEISNFELTHLSVNNFELNYSFEFSSCIKIKNELKYIL